MGRGQSRLNMEDSGTDRMEESVGPTVTFIFSISFQNVEYVVEGKVRDVGDIARGERNGR